MKIFKKRTNDDTPRAETSYMVLQSVEKQLAQAIKGIQDGTPPEVTLISLIGAHAFLVGFTGQDSLDDHDR